MEWQAAVDTYRSLRAGLAAIGVLLGCGLVLLSLSPDHRGVPGSISATFYGPLNGLLVACLLAVGLALFAVKGRPGAENTLLDVAGALIPVVGLVPTPTIDPSCPVPGVECVPPGFRAAVGLGYGAYLLMGLLALVVVGLRLLRAGAAAQADTRRGYLVLAAVWLAGLLSWRLGGELFWQFTHNAAASVFFAILVAVVVINARRPPEEPTGVRERGDAYRRGYTLIAGGMAAGLLGAVGSFLVTGRQAPAADTAAVPGVFWVEAWLLALFVVYWLVQTVELWYHTAPCEGRARTVAPI